MINTIIAEDEPAFNEWLSRKIGNITRINLLACTDNSEDLFALLLQHKPDLAILDIKLAGGDALSVLQRLQKTMYKFLILCWLQAFWNILAKPFGILMNTC